MKPSTSNFKCLRCGYIFEILYSKFISKKHNIYLLSEDNKKIEIMCPECGTFHLMTLGGLIIDETSFIDAL